MRRRARLNIALASLRDLVIDADALSLLGRDVIDRIDVHRRRVFLTPHGGEFDRLFGPCREGGGSNKIDRTVAAAVDSGATVIHKGAATVIATPDGRAVVMANATPWLSTAGTGDVLAGLVGARHAANRDDPLAAGSEAVWLHAAAASMLDPGFVADAVVRCLPAALAAQTWR